MMLIFVLIIIIAVSIYLQERSTIEGFGKGTVYLFWTGGYDSTYRLCELAIVYKKSVQPIYISDPKLDDIKGKYSRKNVDIEMKVMDDIKRKLIEKYPYTENLILPTIFYNKIDLDSDILETANRLYKERKLPRPVNQYAGMAQVTRIINQPIEVGVEDDHRSSMRKAVIDSVGCDKNDCVCELDDCMVKDKNLVVFKNFRFPIINVSKEQMLNKAKQNGYDDILVMTWSCWFPVNGKACNKCPMCKHRIVSSPHYTRQT
jgi:hypothetical protein